MHANSLSKKDCEQTADKLIKALGFENTRKASQISFYHAGLEPVDRAYRHHEWSKGKIKLICATVAFGMGINKPDVRYVIHHTLPQSVTHYYQVCAGVIQYLSIQALIFFRRGITGSWPSGERWRSGELYPLLFLSGFGGSTTITYHCQDRVSTNSYFQCVY